MNKRSVGSILRELRGERSRQEVADSCKISISALSMYENDARRPRDEIKERLAEFYGVSVTSIFFTA